MINRSKIEFMFIFNQTCFLHLPLFKLKNSLNKNLFVNSLHVRQHNFSAFSFICVVFMLISFREDIKILYFLLEWRRLQFSTSNTSCGKNTNLTSNANPRKHLITVTKRLQLCVSEGQLRKKWKRTVWLLTTLYLAKAVNHDSK